MADKYKMYKQIGKLPSVKNKNIIDINPMQSDLEKMGPSAYLMRRATLTGASSITGPFLKRRVSKTTAKVAKDAVTAGLGAGAGYSYAKSESKKEKSDSDRMTDKDIEKTTEAVGKKSGGMIIGKGKDYIKDLL